MTQKNLLNRSFEHDQTTFLDFSIPKNDATHWKQKVASATSKNNEHCQCLQNVSQKCNAKVAKYHFIILWRFEIIEEKLQREGEAWYRQG